MSRLDPAQRFQVLSLLLNEQPEGTWQQKAIVSEPDGRILAVERARLQLTDGTWLDVGRTTNLDTGKLDWAGVKPSELPDEKDHWRKFYLST